MYSEYISEPRVAQLDENSESYKKMKRRMLSLRGFNK